MIKALISDFSGVVLKPVDDSYAGGLNALNNKLSTKGDYDFWRYFQVNENLLTFYKSINTKVDVYVFTTGHIQEHPALQSMLKGAFKEVFSSERLGLNSKDSDAYAAIVDKIGLKPEEILYIDDKPENIDQANSLGINTILYISNEQAIQGIDNYLLE